MLLEIVAAVAAVLDAVMIYAPLFTVLGKPPPMRDMGGRINRVDRPDQRPASREAPQDTHPKKQKGK